MRRAVPLVVAFALLGLVGCAPGTDPPEPSPTAPQGVVPADPLPLEDTTAFGAVAMLNAGSNCTGTVIDTGVDSGPAYVLTNGHCVGGIGLPAQQTVLDGDAAGSAEFFRAAGNGENTVTFDVVHLAYSTMRHTDTAIVRLDATLAEVRAAGITPLPITTAEPSSGDEVVNVGVPVQNLIDDEWVLRRGTCVLGEQHTLIEASWLWFDAWSNDCPGIIQGSSGSPLLRVDDAGAPVEVVAMINTTTSGADPAAGGQCSINRPCEVAGGTAGMIADTSYAQSVAGVGSCFAEDTGEFRLDGACPLPIGDVWSESAGGAFRGGGEPDSVGRLPTVSLVGRTAGTVRTALAPLGDGTACSDPETYATAEPQPLPLAGDPWDLVGVRIDVALGETEGRFLQCAVRGEDYAGAASVLFSVDRTPPVIPAGADVTHLGEAVIVQPHLAPPELAMPRFTWGAPDEVDCDDTESFENFRIIPLVIEAADLPASYCIYAMDEAGNASDVTRVEIPVEAP